MAAFTTPWRGRILESLARNKALASSKYVQLATVKADGRPSCRTVVFRGFLGDTSELTFITNSYSHKVQELAAHPFGEVCWYFTESREQYRLSGALTLVKHDSPDTELLKARQDVWSRLSDASRAQFAWPPSGGARVASAEAFDPPVPPRDSALPAFCLLILSVNKVDYVELFPNKRTIFNLEPDKESGAGAWVEMEVNP